jgi:hypothetical protein
MRKFGKIFWMIGFLVHFIITPYQFGAFLMPMGPLLNESRQPLLRVWVSLILTFYEAIFG